MSARRDRSLRVVSDHKLRVGPPDLETIQVDKNDAPSIAKALTRIQEIRIEFLVHSEDIIEAKKTKIALARTFQEEKGKT
jgi:hypothetical protein